ncbi:YqgQ family protein [Streptococcus gordonii]|nr:YqgQ family protein [Streptococcus gordonii]MCY7137094.1 YqgQ family protein [Streptococcus gordonii]
MKICVKSGTIRHMKTLYDVQQFLKSFGIVIYMGKRLYDIELMKIELERIYDAGLIGKLEYLEAEAVLRREHQLELKYIEKNGEWKK